MVGYALLDEQAEPDPDSGCTSGVSSSFSRTTVTASPAACTAKGAPGEAVDPRTIEVRKVGEKTPRLQSGPAAITGSRS